MRFLDAQGIKIVGPKLQIESKLYIFIIFLAEPFKSGNANYKIMHLYKLTTSICSNKCGI